MIPHELEGKTVADVLDLLERGNIGHRLAMEYFNVPTYAQLVEIAHLNGRVMPGHREQRLNPETMAVFRAAIGKGALEE